MNNGKQLMVIVGLLVALTISSIFWVTRPTKNVIVNQDGKEQPVGALAGPDIPSPYLRWGDVAIYQAKQTFNQASTTVCSLQAPSATSTLLWANVGITTGTSTTVLFEMAKSTLFDATTTLLSSSHSFASGVLGTFTASSTLNTDNGLNGPKIFGPNQYLNVKYGGANGSLNVLQGTCNAAWQVI